MMQEMMNQCCTDDGKPDFEKMKQFMEHFGKRDLSEEQIAKMKGFCGQEGMSDMAKMMEFMEKCGCRPS